MISNNKTYLYTFIYYYQSYYINIISHSGNNRFLYIIFLLYIDMLFFYVTFLYIILVDIYRTDMMHIYDI